MFIIPDRAVIGSAGFFPAPIAISHLSGRYAAAAQEQMGEGQDWNY